jgi:hypothetical protein
MFSFLVENLNLTTNLENYCIYGMLITCKCMPLCKKLNYNAKNDPPYLATTFENDWSIWCSNLFHIKILIYYDYNMHNLTIHKYLLIFH